MASKATFASTQRMDASCRNKARMPCCALRMAAFALLLLWPMLPAQAQLVLAHDPGHAAPAASHESEAKTTARQNLREYSIKAAVIYNFAKFTAWPEAAFREKDAPLRFCILGQDPFGETLKTIVGKSVHGRQLQVSRPDNLAETAQCHLVFVSKSEDHRLPLILHSLAERPILTISEIDDFAHSGGMITIRVPNDRIRFEVNLESTRTAGLYLSSRLLGLAKVLHVQESQNLPLNSTSNDETLPQEDSGGSP